MNIFFLDKDPRECARQHCDKHVVKMVIETAQLLSTAHRLLDGKQWTDESLEELLCLKIYSDCTQFQNKFRRSYWESTPIATKLDFYQWALKMYQTFLYHAQPVPQSKGTPITLYHGLNRLFQVCSLCAMKSTSHCFQKHFEFFRESFLKFFRCQRVSLSSLCCSCPSAVQLDSMGKSPIYQGPFSTTFAEGVAEGFSDGKGLIFSVKGSYSNPMLA